jgi:hypothetical protein
MIIYKSFMAFKGFNAFSPSPLMGEGWGGGEIAGHRFTLSPSPQPPPTRGGEAGELLFYQVCVDAIPGFHPLWAHIPVCPFYKEMQ